MSHKYGGCFTLLDLELPRISRAYPVERSRVLGNSGIDIVTLRECIIKTSHWQVVIKKQKKKRSINLHMYAFLCKAHTILSVARQKRTLES